MRKITREGDIPRVLRRLGMFDNESQTKLKDALRHVDSDVKDMLSNSTFECYECSTVEELASKAMMDDCIKQVIIDKDNDRYYFCALSIDAGRAKTAFEETEGGLIIPVPDESRRPARILFYKEISHEEYMTWRVSNIEERKKQLEEKKEVEEINRKKKERLEGLKVEVKD